MIKAETIINEPFKFKKTCKIYPPTVREMIHDNRGFTYSNLLTQRAEDIYDIFAEDREKNSSFKVPTPFEFICLNAYVDDNTKELYLKAFEFFLHEPVAILSELKTILIGVREEDIDMEKDLDDPRTLTEKDYFDFQNAIRTAIGDDEVTEVEDIKNELPQIARIKALGRKRDRIAAKNKAKNGVSFEKTLLALCCMGIGITPLNIGEITYASVTHLLNMCQNKEKYDVDMHLIYAGADSKKINPEYWIR